MMPLKLPSPVGDPSPGAVMMMSLATRAAGPLWQPHCSTVFKGTAAHCRVTSQGHEYQSHGRDRDNRA